MSTVAERAKKAFEPAKKTLDCIVCHVLDLHEDFLTDIAANLQKYAPFGSIVMASDKHGDINANFKRNFARSKADYCMTVDPHFRFNKNLAKAWQSLVENDLPYIIIPIILVPVSKGKWRKAINSRIEKPPLNLSVIAKTKLLRKWTPKFKYHPIRQILDYLVRETGVSYRFGKNCGWHDRRDDEWGYMKSCYETGLKDAGMPAAWIGPQKVFQAGQLDGKSWLQLFFEVSNLCWHLGYKLGKVDRKDGQEGK